jgi:hypothetical protein
MAGFLEADMFFQLTVSIALVIIGVSMFLLGRYLRRTHNDRGVI